MVKPVLVKQVITLIGQTAIVEMSEAELAVRLVETQTGIRRPEGFTAEKAFDHLRPVVREMALQDARAALLYFGECIKGAKVAS